jgi:MoaA/NifB/PqqE/SkfB family radical SAM enzyme
MECLHCVAKDMEKLLLEKGSADLNVSNKLIKEINKSPFMVLVITGGEPLLKPYENDLIKLISQIDNKAIIIDTNGTIIPSNNLLKLIKIKRVLVRVSWDIPNPRLESILRKYPKNMYLNDLEYLETKQNNIKMFQNNKIDIAIQTVIHKYNYQDNNLFIFPYKLQQLGIKHWYIQRFIPSHHKINENIQISSYTEAINKIESIAGELGIRCHFKKDQRHNSVFLLVRDGDLYTQSNDKKGEKIFLGKLNHFDYFAYVSAPDHSARYKV